MAHPFVRSKHTAEKILDEGLAAHRDHLQALRAGGAVLVSGPLPATDEEPDGALIVVDAPSAAAATALLDADPFRREGLVAEVSVREWVPVIGGFAP